jgi:hypothetical protein
MTARGVVDSVLASAAPSPAASTAQRGGVLRLEGAATRGRRRARLVTWGVLLSFALALFAGARQDPGPPHGRIRGLLSSSTGEPLARHRVMVRGTSGDGIGRSLHAYTEPDGSFRFSDVPAGEAQVIYCGPPGIANAGTMVLGSVDVVAGAESVFEARLPGERTVSGRVLGERDRGYSLFLREKGSDVVVATGEAVSSRDQGRFHLSGLEPGFYTLQIVHSWDAPHGNPLGYFERDVDLTAGDAWIGQLHVEGTATSLWSLAALLILLPFGLWGVWLFVAKRRSRRGHG